jgi:hypothetical protein
MELNDHQCKVLDEMLDGDSVAPQQKKNTSRGSRGKKTEPRNSTPQEPREGLPLDAIEIVNDRRTEAEGLVAQHAKMTQEVMLQRSQSLEQSVDNTAQMLGFKDALTVMSAPGLAAAYTADYLNQFNSLQVNTNFGFTEIDDFEAQIGELLTPKPTLFKPSSRQLAYQEEFASLPESTETGEIVED